MARQPYMRAALFGGGMYFLVHVTVEIVSFYILSAYVSNEALWYIALLFDFYAFVPQGIYGFIRDMGFRLRFDLLGAALAAVSVLLFGLGLPPALTVAVLTLGNGMIHIAGAETTLRASGGKLTPAALFVAGGSFGIILGKLAWQGGVHYGAVFALCLAMLAPMLLAANAAAKHGEQPLSGYRYHNKNLRPAAVAAAAVLVVAARAYMGYGIPTAWIETTAQTIALYVFMGAGKALGGVLTDTVGIRKTALVSTLGALPFLLFGNRLMAVSLLGVMLFSMTMAVTLALLVSVMPRLPGVAFGLTTVGLFLGSFTVVFYKAPTFWGNAIAVTAASLLCALILYFICEKEKKKC